MRSDFSVLHLQIDEVLNIHFGGAARLGHILWSVRENLCRRILLEQGFALNGANWHLSSILLVVTNFVQLAFLSRINRLL